MISQNTKEKIRTIAECIRRRIRNYCEERKLSLYAFAQRANISYSTLRNFGNRCCQRRCCLMDIVLEM